MKPILFNTEMVRAILDGRKTVTRRVVKHQPPPTSHVFSVCNVFAWSFFEDGEKHVLIPLYNPGDILYVRETWRKFRIRKPIGAVPVDFQEIQYSYRADGELCNSDDTPFKWHPSIHMPKEAARLFLRVKSVRVERLQDCGNAQARDEGFTCCSQFARLWDTTIKPADRDKYGWAANPLVWVIEFERCDKPKEDE